MKSKKETRRRARYSIRKKISGTSTRPRLSIYRSNNEIYAQLIDDEYGKTLGAVSSKNKSFKKNSVNKTEQAAEVGKMIAEAAKKIGVEKVVFDRGGFLYHGRIKALADAARESGLIF